MNYHPLMVLGPTAVASQPSCPFVALAGIMDNAEDALANVLAGHRADRLRVVARQLREVAENRAAPLPRSW